MTDATDTPAWRPDPTGRHAQRWFDGTTWTEHVADAHGATSTDPYTGGTDAGPAATTAGAGDAAASGGVDPTTVSPAAGAQSDPTTAYKAPAPSASDPGAAGWAAPAASPEPQAWSQPAPAAQPQPDQQQWGAPPAGGQPATNWGEQQPAPQPGAPVGGWGQQQAPQAAPQGAPGQPAQGWGAQPQQQGYGAPAYGAPAGAYGAPTGASGAGVNPVGAIVTAVGAVLVIISLFALKWIGPGDGGLSDITKAIDNFKQAGIDDVTFLSKIFPSWGYIVALIVGIGSAAAALFVKALKPIAIVLCVVMAAWCLFFAFDIVHWADKDKLGDLSVQIGAYLAAAGFIVAGIGAMLPTKKS